VKLVSEQLEPTIRAISEKKNIYDLLKQDHKDVKKLFKQIVNEHRYRENVYSQIKRVLQAHMQTEEKLFYPRLENNAETRLLILQSHEEHDVSKQIMKDIEMSGNDEEEKKLARIKVLSVAVDSCLKKLRRFSLVMKSMR
jgi:hemerythrin superfamily protein